MQGTLLLPYRLLQVSGVISAKHGISRKHVGHQQFTRTAKGPSTPPHSGCEAIAPWEIWPMEAAWFALCHSRHQRTSGLICPGRDRGQLMNDGSKGSIGEIFSIK